MALDKTLERIDKTISRINTHPEYSANVHREVSAALREDAARHSQSIEERAVNGHPVEAYPSRNDTARSLMEGIDYLSKYGLDISSLAVLGNIVAPDKHPYRFFRRGTVLSGEFSPPDATNVPQEVKFLLDTLQNTSMHPVTRAAEAHLDLVRIHPYEDGNGRAARLVQCFTLQQRGYTAAIIPATDRDIYLTLIGKALHDRYGRVSSGLDPGDNDKVFYEFIASKVLGSAEYLDQELQKRRMYEITFQNVTNKGIVHNIASALRRTPHEVSAKVCDGTHKKSWKIEAVGNISKEQLNDFVGRFAPRYGIKYSVASSV